MRTRKSAKTQHNHNMELSEDDYELVEEELNRPPNEVEEALFVNLWSEHCAYRSSRMFLSDLPSDSDDVYIGPGDDAAVLELNADDADDDTVIAVGMESHNHPSYVDPYDGAATGVGGIVRDILSMGARPIALMDTIYFGEFEREKTRYLFDGVVDGISDYGNSIGVPTVGGQTFFDESYNGNPLVNVVCVGVAQKDDVMTAGCKQPGNKLVLVGSSTGRDGLGGASFASEDLGEEAETEERPAVQVGDPYTEKLLIDATLEIREYAKAARDLGAAGLSGASSEMAAIGDTGARIDLDEVHLRETGMNALEILLSESQERMLFELEPDDVEAVEEIADKYDLEATVIGEVTEGERYVAEFDGETVVDLPAEYLADGAPTHDLGIEEPDVEEYAPNADRDVTEEDALDLLSDPNNASKRWVYRQYDHEVQTRTVVKPGDDACVLNIDGTGLAVSSGCNSKRVDADPEKGARDVVFENAMNLAVKGAEPIAMVDCLNFGNPERPDVYGVFADAVGGLGDMAHEIDVPIVGGNVSLYNESEEFGTAVNPTPSVGVFGRTPDPDAPRADLSEADVGDSVVVVDGTDADPRDVIDDTVEIARLRSVSASHDASEGGLVVALAEMCGENGASVEYEDPFDETYGRVVFVTDDVDAVSETTDLEVTVIGEVTQSGLRVESPDGSFELSHDEIDDARGFIEDEM
ncbi:MAG: phosphoribosylformylglycinamidine synthase subunit PurL [Halobacteria archaeon]|nr:phosphoribosylformylglycinamidine synthase subunit PurL [Halobacteria archaeon]